MREVPEIIQKGERFLLRTARKLAYPRGVPPKNLPTMSGEDLNRFIRESLLADRPFMVARFGSVELSSGLFPYLSSLTLLDRYKLYVQKKIDWIHPSESYALSLIKPLCNNAGFFPEDTSLLPKFSDLMKNDVQTLSCCCCVEWEREDLWQEFLPDNLVYGRLNDMEPYDYAEPWSSALAGKRVLVIHPFAETIKKQYARRDMLWDDPAVLPAFELKTIKAVQSIAGEDVPYRDWFEALDSMKAQMDSMDYDIAIIGCGAYGFHLAAHAKRMGKKAVHLGGATQILFGIKGKRWDELPEVSKLYNDYWVYPSLDETPKRKDCVEHGCYW